MRIESTALFSAEDLDLARQTLAAWRGRVVTWRRRRLGLRGGLLYVAGLPLLIAAPLAFFEGDRDAALMNAVAFCAVVAGARLNRRGLLERLLAPERRYTRPAQVPHQYLAMMLIAVAVFGVAQVSLGHSLWMSTAFSLIVAVGFFFAYGPMALVSPRREPRVRVDDPALRQALQQAESQLLSIESAALDIGNPELGQRLRRVVDRGRTVLAMLAGRPSELFRARRFLAAHLDGAERVAARYLTRPSLVRRAELESPLRNVLNQIEAAFDRQRRYLLKQDRLDLDAQIAVLRRELQRQGIT